MAVFASSYGRGAFIPSQCNNILTTSFNKFIHKGCPHTGGRAFESNADRSGLGRHWWSALMVRLSPFPVCPHLISQYQFILQPLQPFYHRLCLGLPGWAGTRKTKPGR